MTQSTQPLPTLGSPNSTEDSKVRSLLSEIQGIVNGNIDSSNLAASAGVTEAQLAAALVTRLGLGANGRGKSIIATSETRTNTAYGTLTTPDKVTVALPTDGLVFVGYQATWQESVDNAARAAIFIGANQLTLMQIGGAAAPFTANAEASIGGSNINKALGLASYDGGLASNSGVAGATASTGDVTTGQIIGGGLPPQASGNAYQYRYGFTTIFAAAGTYDITVQFKASSGSVTAKNRKLWVWTMGF